MCKAVKSLSDAEVGGLNYSLRCHCGPDDEICHELAEIVDGRIRELMGWVMTTREETTRLALINLGWKPPTGDVQDEDTLDVLRKVARISEQQCPAHLAPARLAEIRDLAGAALWRQARQGAKARNKPEGA